MTFSRNENYGLQVHSGLFWNLITFVISQCGEKLKQVPLDENLSF